MRAPLAKLPGFAMREGSFALLFALPVMNTWPDEVLLRSHSSRLPDATVTGVVRPARASAPVRCCARACGFFDVPLSRSRSMNVRPPSASAVSWNGTVVVRTSSVSCVPFSRTTLLPCAATIPPFVGIAEVTCPGRETGSAALPERASTVRSRVCCSLSPSWVS